MTKPLIVIDPGHGPGNKNQGPTGYLEYAGMWALSNYLKAELEAQGCAVMLTRAENEDPSLTARGQKALKADLFISEHSNAANSQAKGVEVYHSVQVPGDRALAASLSKEISLYMGNPDRGAKTRPSTGSPNVDYYSVMANARKAGCPHVLLIESGFHDNAQDEELLKSDAALKAIAKIQTEVICKALNVSEAEKLTPISGKSIATADQMTAYIRSKNPAVPQSVIDMIPLYLSEGEAEAIRGDIAFAQSCLETGNFTFKGSAVTLDQNNFCGLAVTSNGMKGASFDSSQMGIMAQTQHLKAYANVEPLRSAGNPVDPRFNLVKRGSAPYVEWLGQNENPEGAGWATGEGYGGKILKILEDIMKIKAVNFPPPELANQPSPWAVGAWNWGKANGITDGSNPQGTPTREQVVQMIFNYHKNQTGY